MQNFLLAIMKNSFFKNLLPTIINHQNIKWHLKLQYLLYIKITSTFTTKTLSSTFKDTAKLSVTARTLNTKSKVEYIIILQKKTLQLKLSFKFAEFFLSAWNWFISYVSLGLYPLTENLLLWLVEREECL